MTRFFDFWLREISHGEWIPCTQLSLGAKFQLNREWLHFFDFWLRGELLPWKSAIRTILNGFLALKLVSVQNFSWIENGSIFWFLALWRAFALKSSHGDYFWWIPCTQISLGAKFQPTREWLHLLIRGSVESYWHENQPCWLFLMDSLHSN